MCVNFKGRSIDAYGNIFYQKRVLVFGDENMVTLD